MRILNKLKKTLTMRYKLFYAGIMLSVGTILNGQAFTEKREFHKTVKVNRESSFELNNKYGTVHISTWNKDSIQIKAEIEAYSSSLDRLRKMLQGVNVSITEVSYLVKAETQFVQNINTLFESFKGMTDKLIPYESKIQINYYVSVPEYLNMEIINKYGDVYMEDHKGRFTANISNGTFKANNITDAGSLDLIFCDATINSLKSGRINANFSEILIGESEDLSVTSVSSRFDLRKTGSLDTESRRDKFYIGSAGSVSGDSYFTDFRIENLSTELNLITRYGNLNVNMAGKTLGMLTINSSYTDISLEFDKALSYNLDIRHTNTFLVVPESGNKLEKRTMNEEKKEFMTFGTIGKNPGNVKVVINATRGNIYIK